jgi:HEAT repeat protein
MAREQSEMRRRLAERYVSLLRGTHPGGASYARWRALVDLGDAAVPSLENELRTAEAPIRRWAAVVLARIDSSVARVALGGAVDDDDDQVRLCGAIALARLGDPRALPSLLEAAQRGLPWMRFDALLALGTLGDLRGLPVLAAALRDADSNIRSRAASGLQDFGSAAAPVLLDALRDPDPQLRTTACYALGHAGASGAATALHERLASDDDIWVRCGAAWALGRLRADAALGALVRALGHPAAQLRAAACTALGQLGEATSRARLKDLLEDGDTGVRRAAAQALGALGGADEFLVSRLRVEPDSYALEALIDALAESGSTALALEAFSELALERLCNVGRRKDRRRLRRAIAFASGVVARRLRRE